MNHINTREEVLEAFRVFDKDGRGYVTTDELRQVLNELGEYMDPNEIEELLYEGDPGQSGYVQYDEFVSKLFMWDR
jgi:calmodulin